MNRTSIEWTDFSANPLKFRDATGKVVWGCVHASPGCQHCYAETLAKRYGKGGPFNAPTMAGLTPFLDEKELHRMLNSKKIIGKRVFVGDMTDVFGPWVPDELLDRLFAVFALRQDVTWQILTKRADRMRAYVNSLSRYTKGHCWGESLRSFRVFAEADKICDVDIPLPNVWLGVSCEDQPRADERIPHLLQTPASVRFISAEPLLGRIWIEKAVKKYWTPTTVEWIQWVIIGGESGPQARPCPLEAVDNLVHQCKQTSIPVFVKQLGANLVDLNGVPIKLKASKGNDPLEWPADLRIREFPG